MAQFKVLFRRDAGPREGLVIEADEVSVTAPVTIGSGSEKETTQAGDYRLVNGGEDIVAVFPVDQVAGVYAVDAIQAQDVNRVEEGASV